MPRNPEFPFPIPVLRILRELGRDIRDARRRRRLPMAIIAERAGISRPTLTKVEKGDPSVTMGVYATVLFTLGLSEDLAKLAAPEYDTVGLMLVDEDLPKRIYHRSRHKTPKAQRESFPHSSDHYKKT